MLVLSLIVNYLCLFLSRYLYRMRNPELWGWHFKPEEIGFREYFSIVFQEELEV